MLRSVLVLTALSTVAAARSPTVGTIHPVRILGASPDARWAVICEARADTNGDGVIHVAPGFNGLYGDQMEAFLVQGGGPGAAIEDLVDSDASGRFVVILRAGKLVLLDTIKRVETDLTARDAYASPGRDQPTGAYLGVSFDPAGKHLSYVALVKQHAVVKVRDLALGSEVAIDPGPGKLWSAKLDDSGNVILEVLVAHGATPIAYPSHREPWMWRARRCETSTSSDMIELHGDTPIVRIASIGGGTAADALDYLASLGGATLRRTATGALTLHDGVGTHELLPAACKAKVQGIDPAHQLVVAYCLADGANATLQLVGTGGHEVINAHADQNSNEHFVPFGRHILSTTHDGNDTIYDVPTGKSRVTSRFQTRLAFAGDRTLVLREQHLIRWCSPRARCGSPARSSSTSRPARYSAASPSATCRRTRVRRSSFMSRRPSWPSPPTAACSARSPSSPAASPTVRSSG